MKPKEYLEKIKKLSAKKKTQYLAILIIIAVILLIYFSTLSPSGNKIEGQNKTAVGAEQTADDLEKRLRAALSKVDGAGQGDVVINYASSAELVPATSEDIQSSSSSEDDRFTENRVEKKGIATAQGGEAVIIREDQPEVRGVIVVAQGAGDIGVRMDLLHAVTTLLGVDADKVEILKMAN